MGLAMDLRSMQTEEDGAVPLKLRWRLRKVFRTTCRYAMERTNDHVAVWFWDRNSPSIPSEVENGAAQINTTNWVRSTYVVLKKLP